MLFNTQNPDLIAKFNLTLTLIQLVVVLLCFQGECVSANQTPCLQCMNGSCMIYDTLLHKQ
jgi:hypothetical protein